MREPPEFMQGREMYQFHGSGVATLRMKRVEEQIEKLAGRSHEPHQQKKTSLGYIEKGNRVGSRWEEMLLISVVFPLILSFPLQLVPG